MVVMIILLAAALVVLPLFGPTLLLQHVVHPSRPTNRPRTDPQSTRGLNLISLFGFRPSSGRCGAPGRSASGVRARASPGAAAAQAAGAIPALAAVAARGSGCSAAWRAGAALAQMADWQEHRVAWTSVVNSWSLGHVWLPANRSAGVTQVAPQRPSGSPGARRAARRCPAVLGSASLAGRLVCRRVVVARLGSSMPRRHVQL